MNTLIKVLLSLGLVLVSPFSLATTINGQITDAVETLIVVKNEAKTVVKDKELNKEALNKEALNKEALNKEELNKEEIKNEEIKSEKIISEGLQSNELNSKVKKTEQIKSPITVIEAPAEPDAQQLLEFIDGLRGYKGQSFTFEISNISFKKNKKKHSNKLAVKVLSNASLVEFTAPARSKGRKILKQAQNMWIRFPGTRNVLRISPTQRLLGEASNGDVTGTNFSQDYTATYEGTEIIDDKTVLKLNLMARHDKTTYKQVVFFLDNESHLPLRSDFYARSGKLAKQAYYTKFKEFDGELKLHRMKLVDPIIEGSYTWMMFDKYQKQDLNPAIFHKDALSR
ncbi:MAG: outer membrane lipoprotein-sorting protein [Alteromonadaceae bacterium]|nr:outer membrane lipoprotein-sorting protein [Alteromonadaceae bacterium]